MQEPAMESINPDFAPIANDKPPGDAPDEECGGNRRRAEERKTYPSRIPYHITQPAILYLIAKTYRH